jgi:hypothetical protein
MIKGFFAFFFLFTIFFCGISYLWHITRKEKLQYFRLAVYSAICSVLTLIVLVGIVILF